MGYFKADRTAPSEEDRWSESRDELFLPATGDVTYIASNQEENVWIIHLYRINNIFWVKTDFTFSNLRINMFYLHKEYNYSTIISSFVSHAE